MFKPTTIKDIAKVLNLSTSTVSRALRGGYEISEETKKIVLEYAEKINFTRNPIALSLKERRSYSIGIIVCEVANVFFSQAIDGIESIAYNRGYNIVISQSHDHYEREVTNIQHLANRSVDGIIISLAAETKDYSHIEKLHNQGLPIVFFDRILETMNTHKVTSNNTQGAFEATEYLISKGIKKIAHLANAKQLSITEQRKIGYLNALEKHGIVFDENYVKYCEHGGSKKGEVDTAIKELLDLPQKPDAIFVASDRLSIGCLEALKKYNPKNDILIAGFSNSDVVNLLKPSLSYVRQPAFEMGRIATEMLINLIESKYPVEEFETKILDTTFHINE
ncbi:LacI family DNA-binding transcriptional regulator [Pedobacter sp. SD-b]|uniref:LacI family DNA-binding transcriptional regulator n=1 Tax=Pedobacter segetis TaxID=2793069 RepID=A0ABS1BJN9_9SPHI|nr:LacI family DNA-binding transcriptional regulator [Pedobacter segetis]MBK0383103.1 LacI family DNA-binding transcriptional regulator [Pedobacter segetis]